MLLEILTDIFTDHPKYLYASVNEIAVSTGPRDDQEILFHACVKVAGSWKFPEQDLLAQLAEIDVKVERYYVASNQELVTQVLSAVDNRSGADIILAWCDAPCDPGGELQDILTLFTFLAFHARGLHEDYGPSEFVVFRACREDGDNS